MRHSGFLDLSDKVLPKSGGAFPQYVPSPLLWDAIDEVENNIQAPRPLILSGALTAMSLACQGLIDVRKPNGQVVPVSLMIMSIANSGERKSTVENIFLAPIRDFQKVESSNYQRCYSEWLARFEAWKVRKQVILKMIGQKASKGRDSVADELSLIDHERSKPDKPRQFKMLYEDATSEALFLGLHQNVSTAGLISSEGVGVINGGAMNDLAKQNSLWSGDAITVDRASAESYELWGVRLTVSMMLQDSAFNDYMARRGEKSRGAGLWARFLVCRPQTTQGTRVISNGTMSWEHCEKFTARLSNILNRNLALLEGSGHSRKVICFSPEAKARWLEVFNKIERGILPGGRFESIGDHASKLADNIARVAAIFHYFEEGEGSISFDTLDAAVDLCCWYSDQFSAVFVPPAEAETDALELDDWLRSYRDRGYREIRKNKVLQCGPSKLREKKRLERALDILQDRGYIEPFRRGKTMYLDLL